MWHALAHCLPGLRSNSPNCFLYPRVADTQKSVHMAFGLGPEDL